uniref:Globin family profile domain-containing protein n=1 Tax=Panagrolaimus davidi TaxID=227884 RepID=A0A914PNH2_9BILA
MSHPTNATTLSKYLQQLGGRHVQYTGVTYKCSYWKTFIQALIDVVGVDKNSGDIHESLFLLGNFCVEQMRIGYKIEYLLQREAERIAIAQQKKRDGIAKKVVTYNIKNNDHH